MFFLPHLILWPFFDLTRHYFPREQWRGGCKPRSPLKILILKSRNPPTTFFHLFVSPAEATPEAFTARLSNALVIYCISLCISSSSSFQPSLFIHFHLQFDTTSTHNEAMDKLQNIRRRSQTMNICKKGKLDCAAKFTIFWQCLNPKFHKTRSLGTDGVYQPTVRNHFLQI